MGRFSLRFTVAALAAAHFDQMSAVAGFVHAGATDPTTEGWTLFENPSSTATLGGGTDTKPYWEVDASSNSNSTVAYRLDGGTPGFSDELDNPLGWVYRVTARVEQGIDYGPGGGGGLSAFDQHANSPSFTVLDGNSWAFHLVQEDVADGINVAGAYYQNGSQNLILLQELDITQYHDFELRMHRNGPLSSDDTVSFFRVLARNCG